jgi:hypothetical protein
MVFVVVDSYRWKSVFLRKCFRSWGQLICFIQSKIPTSFPLVCTSNRFQILEMRLLCSILSYGYIIYFRIRTGEHGLSDRTWRTRVIGL